MSAPTCPRCGTPRQADEASCSVCGFNFNGPDSAGPDDATTALSGVAPAAATSPGESGANFWQRRSRLGKVGIVAGGAVLALWGIGTVSGGVGGNDEPTQSPNVTLLASPTEEIAPTQSVAPTIEPTPSATPGPTATPTPLSTPTPGPTPTATPDRTGCDPSYPDVCIPPPPPDLSCSDVAFTDFTVLPPDPHGFDGNEDGVGCEGD
jgi:hypothetical protein